MFPGKWKNKLDPNGMPYKIWCNKQDDTYVGVVNLGPR